MLAPSQIVFNSAVTLKFSLNIWLKEKNIPFKRGTTLFFFQILGENSD